MVNCVFLRTREPSDKRTFGLGSCHRMVLLLFPPDNNPYHNVRCYKGYYFYLSSVWTSTLNLGSHNRRDLRGCSKGSWSNYDGAVYTRVIQGMRILQVNIGRLSRKKSWWSLPENAQKLKYTPFINSVKWSQRIFQWLQWIITCECWILSSLHWFSSIGYKGLISLI